jgi:hypothetical protein
MRVIAFHVSNFSFRGTEVALYDYAVYNQTILGNFSVIVCPETATGPSLDRFSTRFSIYRYRDLSHLESILQTRGVTAMYNIKYGTRDSVLPRGVKNLVHCVFCTDEPHGDVYAGVSRSVASYNNSNKQHPWVNHVVWLPDITTDYRNQLGIPPTATVFGRHGGTDTFNIPYVKQAILRILNTRQDVWFIFAVLPDMLSDVKHPRLISLPAFTDNRVKRKFINTCDAMIHASMLGESFGLSVMEFSFCNKPVITWDGGMWHKQHIHTLGDKCFRYNSEDEVYRILLEFDKERVKGKDWNVVADFTPEKVMREFERVFLKSVPDSLLVEKFFG